jgi:NhaP-type Na+/H+ or K+/H+ antiporter
VVSLFAFSLTLLVTVLFSALAERSVLSTTVIVLLGGLISGESVLNVVHITALDAGVREIVELAVFSTLFLDGMHLDMASLRRTW